MTQEEYNDLCKRTPVVDMVRPFGIDKGYHKDTWKYRNVTILICQRQTLDLIRLTLFSLLRFYPDIPIVVVDGDSSDSSLDFLRYMASKYSNITLHERKGKRHSHGETLDEAIRTLISTKYVLFMDSDIIVERAGWIEGMLQQFTTDPTLYATGARMLVSRENQACGAPRDENDVLKYAHISTAIYHVPTYLTLKPFVDHGSCGYANMIDAQEKGLTIGYYPVDKYISHLSGGSWTSPRTIWGSDLDTPVRPFLTFIVTKGEQIESLKNQTDKDFDIVLKSKRENPTVVIHGEEPRDVTSDLFSIRFNVMGDYVCLLNEDCDSVDPMMVEFIRDAAIKTSAKEIGVGGLLIFERKFWQAKITAI